MYALKLDEIQHWHAVDYFDNFCDISAKNTPSGIEITNQSILSSTEFNAWNL